MTFFSYPHTNLGKYTLQLMAPHFNEFFWLFDLNFSRLVLQLFHVGYCQVTLEIPKQPLGWISREEFQFPSQSCYILDFSQTVTLTPKTVRVESSWSGISPILWQVFLQQKLFSAKTFPFSYTAKCQKRLTYVYVIHQLPSNGFWDPTRFYLSSVRLLLD